MATSGRGTGVVGYNVQTVVDVASHLVIAHEVTNVGHDRKHLKSMSDLAQGAVGPKTRDRAGRSRVLQRRTDPRL